MKSRQIGYSKLNLIFKITNVNSMSLTAKNNAKHQKTILRHKLLIDSILSKACIEGKWKARK